MTSEDGATIAGMLVIGGSMAVVTGGLLAIAWPWRVLGVVAAGLLALTLVAFAAITHYGRCEGEISGSCPATSGLRLGGYGAIVVCLVACGVTYRLVRRAR
jgi:hypothetical protein